MGTSAPACTNEVVTDDDSCLFGACHRLLCDRAIGDEQGDGDQPHDVEHTSNSKPFSDDADKGGSDWSGSDKECSHSVVPFVRSDSHIRARRVAGMAMKVMRDGDMVMVLPS